MEREFGLNHSKREDLAVFKFNLEDCYFLLGISPAQDSFTKEVLEAIDWLEERKKAKAEGPGINIVVTDARNQLADRALGMIGR